MTPEDLMRRNAEEALRLRIKSAQLSMEIERQIIFKDGPLNYILASAFQEAVDALIELIDVAPTDVDKIRTLQNDIKRYGDICHWLAAAVQTGADAHKLLNQTDIVDGWDKAFVATDGDDET